MRQVPVDGLAVPLRLLAEPAVVLYAPLVFLSVEAFLGSGHVLRLPGVQSWQSVRGRPIFRGSKVSRRI